MKKQLIKSLTFVLVITGLISCKKSYTCECTTDYGGGYKTVEKRTFPKASKREAENMCKDYDITDISTSGTDNYKVSCSIK